MAHYEMMVILDPTQSESDTTKTIDTIKKIVTDAGGKVAKEDNWGEKKFAYKINGSDVGIYVLFELEMDGWAIKQMNNLLNLEKWIWRYMFVNQDA